MNRTRSALSAAAVFAALFLLVSPASAEQAPISWSSTDDLVLDPSTRSTTETVLNQTSEPIALEIRPGKADTLDVNPSMATLPAGGALDIRLTSKTTDQTSTNTLIVVANPIGSWPVGFVLRRDVRYAPARSPSVTTLRVSSSWGWLGGVRGDVLPISGSASCEGLNLPPGTVGYVQSDDGKRASVTARCKDDRVRVGFDNLSRTGTTYDGTATILGKELTIALRRSATPVLPILCLGAGCLLGLWLMARVPSRIIGGLKQRLRAVRARVGTVSRPGPAIVDFRKRGGKAPWSQLDVFASLALAATKIDSALHELRRSRRFTLKDDDDEVDGLTQQIEALEGAIDGLGPLAEALETLDRTLPAIEESRLIPTWLETTGKPLVSAKESTDVGTLPELKAEAVDAAALAHEWPAVVQQVRAVDTRLNGLEIGMDRRPPGERERIINARSAYDMAAGAFARAATTHEVREAYDKDFTAAMRATDGLASIEEIRDVAWAGPVTDVLSSLLVPLSLHSGAPTAGNDLTAERRAGRLAIMLTAALLLLAGLEALYVGKAFGTAWDFLGAAAWGAASGTIALPVATAVENYRRIG